MTRAFVVFLTVCSSALQAQQQPLVGTWQVTYPAGLRIENGAPTPIMASGALTIEARDDSLIGQLVTDSSPDLPARPPARLAARANGGDVIFISRTRATLSLNGDERETTAVSTWTLVARGDTLSGTVERRLEGLEAHSQGPAPVTGTRRKP
jgi:hypothetical protein